MVLEVKRHICREPARRTGRLAACIRGVHQVSNFFSRKKFRDLSNPPAWIADGTRSEATYLSRTGSKDRTACRVHERSPSSLKFFFSKKISRLEQSTCVD